VFVLRVSPTMIPPPAARFHTVAVASASTHQQALTLAFAIRLYHDMEPEESITMTTSFGWGVAASTYHGRKRGSSVCNRPAVLPCEQRGATNGEGDLLNPRT